MNQTADLLDALRRRRGEREAASFEDEPAASSMHPSTGSIRIVDIPLDSLGADLDEARTGSPQPSLPAPANFMHATGGQPKVGRKGRQSMPSWDEIVFGARSDDDLA
jgi:hypothetical protein